MQEGGERLTRLADALERRFVEAGLGSTDKPFSPHLTIGRVKVPERNPRLEEAIRTLTFEGAEFMINGLTLTKSELRPGGPVYSPVVVAKLGVAEQ
jgi:2'-5' RNA ligase